MRHKNTGVGNLSLLQGNLLNQESNWGPLYCSRFFTLWATREAQSSWEAPRLFRSAYLLPLVSPKLETRITGKLSVMNQVLAIWGCFRDCFLTPWVSWLLVPASLTSLEKGMATHSSILTWEIPWTEESGGLLSMEWQNRHDLAAQQQITTNKVDLQIEAGFLDWLL